MDLSIYDVIKRPRITSKAYFLNQRLQQLVLEVHPKANKPMVSEALKKLFNVDAVEIRMMVQKGKNRRVGRFHTKGISKKKAVITLKKGQAVDLMGWNQMGIPQQENQQAE
jgi:large subunit ribosomal protein L23